MALRASWPDYFAACQLGMVLRTSWIVHLKVLLRSVPSDLPVLSFRMGCVPRLSGVFEGAVLVMVCVLVCVCVCSGGGTRHVEWPFGPPGLSIVQRASLGWSLGLPGMLA